MALLTNTPVLGNEQKVDKSVVKGIDICNSITGISIKKLLLEV